MSLKVVANKKADTKSEKRSTYHGLKHTYQSHQMPSPPHLNLKKNSSEYSPRMKHRLRLRSVSLFERQYEKQIKELEEQEEMEAEELRKKKLNKQSIDSKDKRISHFSQQNLASTFPTITVTKVYRRIAISSFSLYLIGFMTYLANESVVDYTIEYSRCVDHRTSAQCENTTERRPCVCKIPFNLTKRIPRNVFMYYQIDGMFQ